MFGKYDGWDNIFSDDPLGFKRDAAIKAQKDNSLSSMDLFSDLSAREKIELDGLINADGSLDKVGLAFSSFIEKVEPESQFSNSMKFFAASSMGGKTEEESFFHNGGSDELVEGYDLGSDITEEEMAFYLTECELNTNEPAIQEQNLSLSEKLEGLKALDHHRVLVFCPNLVEGAYTKQTITSVEFLARFKIEKYST